MGNEAIAPIPLRGQRAIREQAAAIGRERSDGLGLWHLRTGDQEEHKDE